MQLDYASILAGGQRLVPDLRSQLIEDALLKQQQTVFQQQQQDRAAQMQAAAAMKAREGEFQAALDAAMMSGDPRAIQSLRLRFPEFTKGMKDAFDAFDEDVRRTNLTQIGSIYANLNAGNTGRAVELLRARIEADRAAGMADPQDEAILTELESGDPMRINAAKGTVGIMLAAIEPEKFGETYGKLNPAESKPAIQREVEYYRSIGRDDLAEQLLTNNADPLVQITGPAGTNVIPRSQALGGGIPQQGASAPATQGGGDPSGSRAAIPATGAAIESAALSAVPGLVVTSRQRSPARNAAVGGVANSFHLTDQARDFVPPQGMSMGQLAQRLKAAMPGFDVINEGDHVHVEPPSRSQGPVRVRSVQEARKLPSGTMFITPDGRTMRKP